jgi:hypothetical protein
VRLLSSPVKQYFDDAPINCGFPNPVHKKLGAVHKDRAGLVWPNPPLCNSALTAL